MIFCSLLQYFLLNNLKVIYSEIYKKSFVRVCIFIILFKNTNFLIQTPSIQ